MGASGALICSPNGNLPMVYEPVKSLPPLASQLSAYIMGSKVASSVVSFVTVKLAVGPPNSMLPFQLTNW